MQRWLMAVMLLAGGACRHAPASTSAPSPAPPRVPADPAPASASQDSLGPRAPSPSPSPESLADPQGMTGIWSGTYFFAHDTANPQPPVYFFAELALEDDMLTGFVIEPNTFGDASNAQLRADIRGLVEDDGSVAFLKTYDGTAGVSHVVQYQGQLDAGRTRIEGQWMVSRGGWGPFVMTRQARPVELAALAP